MLLAGHNSADAKLAFHLAIAVPPKSSTDHRSFTCLDGFTRKFSLYNSQMLTIVQQLWRSLTAITVWSPY